MLGVNLVQLLRYNVAGLRDRAGLHRLVVNLTSAAEDYRVRRVHGRHRAVGVADNFLL